MLVYISAIIDFFLGDPKGFPHPIILVGKLISLYEKILYRDAFFQEIISHRGILSLSPKSRSRHSASLFGKEKTSFLQKFNYIFPGGMYGGKNTLIGSSVDRREACRSDVIYRKSLLFR